MGWRRLVSMLALIVMLLGGLQASFGVARADDCSTSQNPPTHSQTQATTFGTNNNSTGDPIPWVNPTNIYTLDNNASTAFMSDLITYPRKIEYSNYLVATHFHFTLHNDAIINGVCVRIYKHNTQPPVAGTPGIFTKDYQVYLVVDGAAQGTNHAQGQWPLSYAYSTYGSNSDSWGVALDYTKVNSVDFGIALSAWGGNPDPPGDTLSVDYIEIIVIYSN